MVALKIAVSFHVVKFKRPNILMDVIWTWINGTLSGSLIKSYALFISGVRGGAVG